MSTEMKTGLVLSGGGAVGAYAERLSESMVDEIFQKGAA